MGNGPAYISTASSFQQGTFPAGTVTAPGLSVATDSTSGLYQATTGTLSVAADSVAVTEFIGVGSGVNFVKITAATTTNPPLLQATGSDTNVGLDIGPKGTGTIALGGTSAATSSLQVTTAASQVNFVQLSGATTGNPPTILATGTDSTVGLVLNTKSTGSILLETGGTAGLTVDGNHLLEVTVTNSITAHSAGGQASATALTTTINRITTAGAGAASVALPLGVAGMLCMVTNSAASNAIQVFGQGSDTINGIATATGVSQAAGVSALYYCVTTAPAAAWFRVQSS